MDKPLNYHSSEKKSGSVLKKNRKAAVVGGWYEFCISPFPRLRTRCSRPGLVIEVANPLTK